MSISYKTESRGVRPAAFLRRYGAKLGGKMREDGIAHSMLQALSQELATRPAVKVRRLFVKVGELTGVDPGELERSFETLTSGTEMAALVYVVTNSVTYPWVGVRVRRRGATRCVLWGLDVSSADIRQSCH